MAKLPLLHAAELESMLTSRQLMHAEYTKVRGDRPLLPQIVKKDITPSLSKPSGSWPNHSGPPANVASPDRLNPHLAEEVDLTLAEELPPCEDWTPVPINKLLLRIVAKVSGRIFVGPEVGRTEEYVDMAINYTVEAGIVQNILAHMKPWQRFLFGRSLPQSKTLEKRYKTSKDFLRPMIVARREAMKTPGYEKPYDVMQWVLDMGEAKLGKDDQLIETLTDIQLGLTFAAIHTTTLTATNAYATDSFSHISSDDESADQSLPFWGVLFSFLGSIKLLRCPSFS